MKTKTIFLLCFLCSIVNKSELQAQSKFVKGFVVSTEQDTIHGLLQEVPNLEGYNIHLKKRNKSEVAIYTPEMISQYYLSSGTLYETNEISIDEQKTKVFLKCHIKGSINFYTFTDINYVDYYFIKTIENNIRELIEEEKIKRDEEGIKSVLRSYYKCMDEQFIEYKEAKQKLILEFGLLTSTNWRFNSENVAGSNRWGYGLSPFLNFYFPKSKNRYSLEVRYEFALIGLQDEIVRTHMIPLRINRYFPTGNSRLSTNLGLNLDLRSFNNYGPVLGIGYDFKLNRLRLRSIMEYRFFYTRVFRFGVGIGFL